MHVCVYCLLIKPMTWKRYSVDKWIDSNKCKLYPLQITCIAISSSCKLIEINIEMKAIQRFLDFWIHSLDPKWQNSIKPTTKVWVQFLFKIFNSFSYIRDNQYDEKFILTLMFTELSCVTKNLNMYGIWRCSIDALSWHNLQVVACLLMVSLSRLEISAIGPNNVPHVLQISV